MTAPDRHPADTASTPLTKDRMAPGGVVMIGLLMASTFVVLLNEMLLGVALPTLIVDLRINPTTGQWLTTSYLLTLAVLIPATGFVMRRFQMRTIFLVAMSLFFAGTAIAAVAPGFAVLLAGRIVQATGAAVFIPLLMTTAMRLVPEARRGRVMALVTAVPATAPAFGPAISGLVLSGLSWRWLFIIMLPVAAASLAVGAWKLRNITEPERVGIDVASVALSAVGFGALVYGLASIGESVSGHSPIPPYLPIAVGLAGVALFVRRQVGLQRRDAAFLDMRIFGARSYTVPILVMTVVAMIGFAVTIVLPLVLTAVTGLSTLQIGLFLMPGGAMIAIVSALGGRVYDRFGPRPLVIPGAAIWVASLWFLSTLDDGTSVWTLLTAYLILSSSQAMMWAPITTTAFAALRADLYPHGTAAFTTVQQLAGAAGGAVLISAYTIGAGGAGAEKLTTAEAVSAAQAAFTAAGVIGLGALVGAFFVRAAARQGAAPPAPDASGAESAVAPDARPARQVDDPARAPAATR